MLKYLFIAGTTAIVNLVLVFTSSPQIASAAMELRGSASSISQDKLITKDSKSIRIDAHQQSDIQSIHNTLTQYYRGFNEGSITRMEQVSVAITPAEKQSLRELFTKFKAYHIDWSVEVGNIELLSLSSSNALVNIQHTMKMQGPQKSGAIQQLVSISLLKQHGKWKVSNDKLLTNTPVIR